MLELAAMFKGVVRNLDATQRLRVNTSPASRQTHGWVRVVLRVSQLRPGTTVPAHTDIND